MYVTTNSSNLKNDLSWLFDIVCLRHNHIMKVKVCIWYLLKCREKSLHDWGLHLSFPLWSLLMQRGHLQPSLRAGGLESYCRTAQVSTLQFCSCNVITEASAPTDGTAVAAGSLILIEYCFGALYHLTAIRVTFHFTSCWFL